MCPWRTTGRYSAQETRFLSTALFANHGTLEVAPDTTFSIFPDRFGEPADSGEAVFYYPGIANYSFSLDADGNRQGALLGGEWDISGNLSIVGAAITELGGNTAVSEVGSGTRLDDWPVAMAGGESKRISEGRPGRSKPAWDAFKFLRAPVPAGEPRRPSTARWCAIAHGLAALRRPRQPGRADGRWREATPGRWPLCPGWPRCQHADCGRRHLPGRRAGFAVRAGRFRSAQAVASRVAFLPSGTSVLVRAPLLESEEINPFTGLVESRRAI